jgi:hypothetical protein
MAETTRTATNQESVVSDDAPPALVTWCLGAFHVAALTVVAVLALQRGGAVGDLLSGLDTAIGLGLYGFLWAVTWWTTRRGLRAAWRDGRGPTWKNGLVRALAWGGVTGIVFFTGLFVALLVVLVALGEGALATLEFGLVGAVVAAVVGAVVGGVLGLLDMALLRAAWMLDGTAPNDRD